LVIGISASHKQRGFRFVIGQRFQDGLISLLGREVNGIAPIEIIHRDRKLRRAWYRGLNCSRRVQGQASQTQ
jgi:hypothetical protein